MFVKSSCTHTGQLGTTVTLRYTDLQDTETETGQLINLVKVVRFLEVNNQKLNNLLNLLIVK